MTAHFQRNLIQFLQKERTKRGFSYAQLAAASGLDPATVHSTLTGKSRMPRWITIEAIALALGYHHELIAKKS